jgi:hypothetical protein
MTFRSTKLALALGYTRAYRHTPYHTLLGTNTFDVESDTV